MPWPPYATDLMDENISLPNSVYNLFAWIPTDHNDFQPQNGRDEKVDLKGHSVKLLVLSLGQDPVPWPGSVYLDVSAIPDAAGPQLCDAIPGLHAFTGCDSLSSF